MYVKQIQPINTKIYISQSQIPYTMQNQTELINAEKETEKDTEKENERDTEKDTERDTEKDIETSLEYNYSHKLFTLST